MASPLKGKEIVVGVCGSIAAYKVAGLVSTLVQEGAGVEVVMTRAGAQFVGPLTFQTLTGRRVLVDPFDLDYVVDPSHVSLADKADLVVVAPATANILGKAANGIADDALSSLLLSVDCPVLVAPAMNTRMWNHPAVQANIATLRERGVRFVEPGTGKLACGTEGVGRLADPGEILAEITSCMS